MVVLTSCYDHGKNLHVFSLQLSATNIMSGENYRRIIINVVAVIRVCLDPLMYPE